MYQAVFRLTPFHSFNAKPQKFATPDFPDLSFNGNVWSKSALNDLNS